ncbi:MAG: hypothetical protein LUG65_04000, partial [Clostridiales bacterium]|nr:hypothetical protein [Clostridiales bacterium]
SEKLVPSTVGRLVKQVGADTTLKNAQRDGAQFAWVPHGDSCAFCLMLASRGWQYMSKKALRNSHAEHIHANCDCQYAVRFDGKSTVEGYDPDKYRKIYDFANGNDSTEKINSIRRMMNTKKGGLTVDQLDFVIDAYVNPSVFFNVEPATLYSKLNKLGFKIEPLKRGNIKGVAFEDGGGYGVNYLGSGYLQYHPKNFSHHKQEYYKISLANRGKKRYNINGEEVP